MFSGLGHGAKPFELLPRWWVYNSPGNNGILEGGDEVLSTLFKPGD